MAIKIEGLSKKGRGPTRKTLASSKKGRPMPETYGGCGGDEEKKHSFQIYGKPLECCVKCGQEHRSITEWRTAIAETGGYIDYPYVAAGILSGREYVEMMRKGGGFLR